jgi:hypothetical protein
MSWDEIVRSVALEGGVWGPHSLHTAEINHLDRVVDGALGWYLSLPAAGFLPGFVLTTVELWLQDHRAQVHPQLSSRPRNGRRDRIDFKQPFGRYRAVVAA